MTEKGPREWSPQGGAPGTLGRFIHQNKITMTYEPISERPDRQNLDEKEQKWQDESFHYRVTLRRGTKRITTLYSKGAALRDPPEADEVLSSLALDSQGLESSRGFEDWAAEYGFDTDSRKAEKLYKACLDVSEKLKRFLGDEQYDQLLNHTEQL